MPDPLDVLDEQVDGLGGSVGAAVGDMPGQDFGLPGSDGSIRFVVAGVPSALEADTYKVGLANNSIGPHVLVAVGGLPEEITEDEFIQVLDEVNAGAPPPAGAFEAGAVFAKPGQDHQKLFDLTSPGQYGYFCPIPNPAGIPHYKLGFVGFFDVTAN